MGKLNIKLLLGVTVGCYMLLGTVLGSILFALIPPEGTDATSIHVAMMLSILAVPFLLAGYFTARYAHNRPQLHVLLVALLGSAVVFLIGNSAAQAAIPLPLVVLGAFGARWRLRSGR